MSDFRRTPLLWSQWQSYLCSTWKDYSEEVSRTWWWINWISSQYHQQVFGMGSLNYFSWILNAFETSVFKYKYKNFLSQIKSTILNQFLIIPNRAWIISNGDHLKVTCTWPLKGILFLSLNIYASNILGLYFRLNNESKLKRAIC